MPSVMTLLPGTVSRQRLPMAVGVVGIAGNISLALTPAVMLWVMELAGLPAVGLATCVVVAMGAVLIWPVRDGQREERRARGGRLMMRTVWKPEWFRPLLVTTLIIVNWGVITGYLPQRAEAAGADVGLFFTMDALALTALRIPSGWLAGRIGPVPMLLAGSLITAGSIALLLLPASTLVLVISGLGTGAGSALVFPVLNLEINERSEPSNRGSAFGLYSVAFGAGVAIGSLGLAPFYAIIGWEIALGIGIGAAVLAGIVAVLDPLMHHPPIGRIPAEVPPAASLADRATAEG
jgi:MFS family permease